MIAYPSRLAASIRAGAFPLLLGLLLAWAAPAEAHCPDDAAAGGHAHHAAGQDGADSAAADEGEPDGSSCCPGMACGTAALPQGLTVLATRLPDMPAPPLRLDGGPPAETGPPREPPRS